MLKGSISVILERLIDETSIILRVFGYLGNGPYFRADTKMDSIFAKIIRFSVWAHCNSNQHTHFVYWIHYDDSSKYFCTHITWNGICYNECLSLSPREVPKEMKNFFSESLLPSCIYFILVGPIICVCVCSFKTIKSKVCFATSCLDFRAPILCCVVRCVMPNIQRGVSLSFFLILFPLLWQKSFAYFV